MYRCYFSYLIEWFLDLYCFHFQVDSRVLLKPIFDYPCVDNTCKFKNGSLKDNSESCFQPRGHVCSV